MARRWYIIYIINTLPFTSRYNKPLLKRHFFLPTWSQRYGAQWLFVSYTCNEVDDLPTIVPWYLYQVQVPYTCLNGRISHYKTQQGQPGTELQFIVPGDAVASHKDVTLWRHVGDADSYPLVNPEDLESKTVEKKIHIFGGDKTPLDWVKWQIKFNKVVQDMPLTCFLRVGLKNYFSQPT